VNTASVAGLVGLPYASAYVASKPGVVGLTKTEALEYAQQGIRVNCVCPGYIQTPMTAAGMHDPARRALMLASELVGRLGQPEEVAAAVVWLCSDAASFVTGHELVLHHAGSGRCSFLRASVTGKRQSMVACSALRWGAQAAISRVSVAASGMRRSRHCC
jgi:NAD(P)-dependent dehydrogenase (short-subunit alcohol dehydrogenase family)